MRVRGGSGAAAGPVPPPAGLRPMQPTAVRELPADQASWAFEPKWDGYRALGHVVGGGLALRSRNGVDMAGWFPELAGLAEGLGGRGSVLDGEVVAFDDRGRPSFEALQRRMAGRAGRRRGAPVTYLVFDLLWLEGRLLTGLPYAERRRLLEDLAVAGDAWQTVGSFPGAGTALLGHHRRAGPRGGGGQAAGQHLPARPPHPELAQGQALPARDLRGRRVRARPRGPGPLPAGRPARPGAPGPATVRRAGRGRPGAGGPAAGRGPAGPPGHRPEPVRRAAGGPARRPLEPARAGRPGPGVRPPQGGRGGHLPRLGGRPAAPPGLQRPGVPRAID